jgi:uncharacterized protein
MTHPVRSDETDVTDDVSTAGPRIHALDTLRGFALCGILIINIYQQVVFRGHASGSAPKMPLPVQLLFYERFYPIFAVLFGVGFGIFLRRASRRTARPRVVLARRLGWLLLVGLAHTLVLLAVGPQLVVGYGPIPGLLALGYALAMLDVPADLERRTGRVAVAFVVFGSLAAVWIWLQVRGTDLPFVNVVGGPGGGVSLLPPVAGIVTGLAYCCGLLLLLRTPVGPALSAVLSPMGRMALTNYLSVLFLVLGPLLGIDSTDDIAMIVLLTVGILAVQAVWSTLWLRSFRYGPMEWLWRCLTWWRRAPIRGRAAR